MDIKNESMKQSVKTMKQETVPPKLMIPRQCFNYVSRCLKETKRRLIKTLDDLQTANQRIADLEIELLTAKTLLDFSNIQTECKTTEPISEEILRIKKSRNDLFEDRDDIYMFWC